MKKFKKNQTVEVKILDQWYPAFIESDLGGGWYSCNLGLRSDIFGADNIRKANF